MTRTIGYTPYWGSSTYPRKVESTANSNKSYNDNRKRKEKEQKNYRVRKG